MPTSSLQQRTTTVVSTLIKTTSGDAPSRQPSLSILWSMGLSVCQPCGFWGWSSLLFSRWGTNRLDQRFSSCAFFVFVLRTLRSHGLRPHSYISLPEPTTVASQWYASPAWCGLASAEYKSRMERLIVRLLPARWLYVSCLGSGWSCIGHRFLRQQPESRQETLLSGKSGLCSYNLRTRAL